MEESSLRNFTVDAPNTATDSVYQFEGEDYRYLFLIYHRPLFIKLKIFIIIFTLGNKL